MPASGVLTTRPSIPPVLADFDVFTPEKSLGIMEYLSPDLTTSQRLKVVLQAVGFLGITRDS